MSDPDSRVAAARSSAADGPDSEAPEPGDGTRRDDAGTGGSGSGTSGSGTSGSGGAGTGGPGSGGAGAGGVGRGHTPLWLRSLLVLSLGLNLLVAGFVAGRTLDIRREVRQPAPRDVAAALGLGPYYRALERDQRRALGRDVFAEIAADGGPRSIRAGLRESFGAVLATLRAEPFDAATLAGLVTGQAESAERLRRIGQEALVARIAAMTPSERRAFADRLEDALRTGRRAR
jgi:uncharacterized membrane protein